METYTHLYNTTKFWFPFWSELSRKQLMLASFFFFAWMRFKSRCKKLKRPFFLTHCLVLCLLLFLFLKRTRLHLDLFLWLVGGVRFLVAGDHAGPHSHQWAATVDGMQEVPCLLRDLAWVGACKDGETMFITSLLKSLQDSGVQTIVMLRVRLQLSKRLKPQLTNYCAQGPHLHLKMNS